MGAGGGRSSRVRGCPGRGRPGENSSSVSPRGRSLTFPPCVVPNIKDLIVPEPAGTGPESRRAAKTQESRSACEGLGRVNRSSPGWPSRRRDPDHVVHGRQEVSRRHPGRAGPPPPFIPAPLGTQEALETSPVREADLFPILLGSVLEACKLNWQETDYGENRQTYSCAYMVGSLRRNMIRGRIRMWGAALGGQDEGGEGGRALAGENRRALGRRRAVGASHVSARGQGAAPSPRGDRLPWWLQGGHL